MKSKIACLLLLLTVPAYCLSPKTKRRLTFAALLVVQALDVHSSLGKYEANPLYRDRYGKFSPRKAVLIKAAAMTALAIAEERTSKDDVWVYVNIGATAALTPVVVRNYSIPSATATPPNPTPTAKPGSASP